MVSPPAAEDVRSKIALIVVGAVIAIVLLYLANILYLQSLILVWAAAIILGTYVYDKKADAEKKMRRARAKPASAAEPGGGVGTAPPKPGETLEDSGRRNLWSAKERLEDNTEHRRGQREQDFERMVMASGANLQPLPPRQGFWKRRSQEQKELSHLVDALDEALEVLATDRPDAARARLSLIASDLKAHHGALRTSKPFGGRADDYAASWAVLYSISRGGPIEAEAYKHAPRKAKAKLDALIRLAAAKGVLAASSRTDHGDGR